MGGAVSTGEDNDDLIDKLIEADYIKSPEVERIFRAVDRADYFTPNYKDNAYKDLAWKDYNLHISAPCIYSEVMERLQLRPGISFLNMGSGTGYLSTMVGLSLGPSGVNHGVEIYPEVVEYANTRLDHFMRFSPAIDQYEFCNPEFVVGNCLCLPPDTRRYDRIYCGAGCPEGQETYIKNLLKVGGVLVMPFDDQLEQIERTSETEWKTSQVLAVSFSTLIAPEKNSDAVILPSIQNRKLQDMCRSVIRNLFRSIIEADHPNLKTQPPRVTKRKAKKRPMSQMFMPIMQHLRDSDNEEDSEGVDNGTHDSNSSSTSDADDTKMALAMTFERRRIERRRRRAARCAMLRAVIQQVANGPPTEITLNSNETEVIDEPPPLVEVVSLPEESAHVTEEPIKENQPSRKSTRETADSGVGDEIAESVKNDVPSESEKKMEQDDSDSDFDEEPTDFDRDSKEDSSGKEEVKVDGRTKLPGSRTEFSSSSSATSRPQRSVCRHRKGKLNSSIAAWKKYMSDCQDEDSSSDDAPDVEKEPSVAEKYTRLMKEKIQQLPLPTSLQLYLNYNRPF